MDPNVVAAIIGGLSGLGGAIIGGIIVARATNRATKQANTHALQMHQAAQNATVRGVLLGIRAEITTLGEIYTAELAPCSKDSMMVKHSFITIRCTKTTSACTNRTLRCSDRF